MKYIVILADGMADYPVEALGGKTPMEVAEKPCMDSMAAAGEQFLVKTVPDNLKPGSDVANLTVMGYDTAQCYTGRSPLEAASIGVTLAENETSFRANLVSLGGEGTYDALSMLDYSAGEISTKEAHALIKTLQEKLIRKDISLYPGISYRHLLVWKNPGVIGSLTPPHDISDRPVKDYLPSSELLRGIMEESREILRDHPVNAERRKKGLRTADSLWIWGEGKKPSLPNFYETYGKKGAVISAVDLIRGIGYLAGMQVIDVPGVTGNVDTNFPGKARAAVETLLRDGNDFVYVHMEAPDECGHRGETENKVKSIEYIDKLVVQYMRDELEKAGEAYRMLILPDHPTPICIKTHARDPVPCLLYDSRVQKSGKAEFTEKSAAGGPVVDPGYKLMREFLNA
ncbi:MAG: cofactor-independent phosphoglycerate mutase [Ruminococcaceae bacterium]|nr:cofactor-independent phosphoglycerate mutase [Oscillospiraceae bacterium]